MNQGEQFFVRNHRRDAALDDPDASNMDLLIVVGQKFAILNFKVFLLLCPSFIDLLSSERRGMSVFVRRHKLTRSQVGTATTDPEGSGSLFSPFFFYLRSRTRLSRLRLCFRHNRQSGKRVNGGTVFGFRLCSPQSDEARQGGGHSGL